MNACETKPIASGAADTAAPEPLRLSYETKPTGKMGNPAAARYAEEETFRCPCETKPIASRASGPVAPPLACETKPTGEMGNLATRPAGEKTFLNACETKPIASRADGPAAPPLDCETKPTGKMGNPAAGSPSGAAVAILGPRRPVVAARNEPNWPRHGIPVSLLFPGLRHRLGWLLGASGADPADRAGGDREFWHIGDSGGGEARPGGWVGHSAWGISGRDGGISGIASHTLVDPADSSGGSSDRQAGLEGSDPRGRPLLEKRSLVGPRAHP